MSLSARAIATQGVGFGALLIAVQGFLPIGVVEPPAFALGGGRFIPAREAGPIHFLDDRELLEMVPIIIGVLNNAEN